MGTLGRLQPLLLSLSAPPHHAFHNSLVLSYRKSPSKMECSRRECCSLTIPWVLGAHPALPICREPGERWVCQPGYDVLLPLDQLPFLILPHIGETRLVLLSWSSSCSHAFMWCWLGFWQSVSHLLDNPQISKKKYVMTRKSLATVARVFIFWSKCVISGDP